MKYYIKRKITKKEITEAMKRYAEEYGYEASRYAIVEWVPITAQMLLEEPVYTRSEFIRDYVKGELL